VFAESRLAISGGILMKNERIYFSDGRLTVRSMRESDILAFCEAFAAQGWFGKNEEQFRRYYHMDQSGERLIIVAEVDGHVAGYTTLMKEAEHGPFAHSGIPYVCDFNVLKSFQRQGIGTKIMDCVENLAFETHDSICIGVGLYRDYGTAQRMYAKRGYIPDGSGVWFNNVNLEPGAPCINDDDLILYMAKSK